MTPAQATSFPEPEHDHARCVAEALAEAARLCQDRGVRLTAIRRRVLELVWANHKPVGAYDILAALRRDHSRAAPPTVYRALDFLQAQGFVHRIESLNAFVGCPSPSEHHAGQFLICTACGTVAELESPALADSIARRAAEAGFTLSHAMLEISGRCGHCHGDESASPRPARTP